MIFGIIGYGRFGKLWAKALVPFGQVNVYDNKSITTTDDENIKISTLHEAAQADVVFILTPISVFTNVCSAIKMFIKSSTIIIDCCSVKMYPVNIMQKIFPQQQTLIATHPLFGPDLVKKNGGLAGCKIVVCPIQGGKITLNKIITIFKKMGLAVLITTPEDHDKQMANSQALIHFIGRGLAALEMEQQELATPDFQALLHINKMVINDSWQLFLDMHNYNIFTKDIREKFIKQLCKINDEVNSAHN